MKQLDPYILSTIFIFTDIPTILQCSLACRYFHQVILDSSTIQCLLRSHHQGLPIPVDPSPTSLDALIMHPEKTRKNLEELRPKITQFELPVGHEVFSVYGEYMVTRPIANDWDQHDETGEELVCSIWHKSNRKDVTVPYQHSSDCFALDFEQDVMVIAEFGDYGAEIYHFYHIFASLQDGLKEYDGVQGGIRINDYKWESDYGPRIQLLEDGRMMIAEWGAFLLYHWRTGRLPPDNHGAWRSNNAWTVTHNNMLVGVDLPVILGQSWLSVNDQYEIASLAVFKLDEVFPHALGQLCIPNLLLEIPLSDRCLPYVVRKLMNLPATVSVRVETHDDHPHMLETPNCNFILLATYFVLHNSTHHVLKIAVPVDELRKFANAQTKQVITADQMNTGQTHVWKTQVNPFKGVNRIFFSKWRHIAHVWVEPVPQAGSHNLFWEAQHRFTIVTYDHELLTRSKNLRITIDDLGSREQRLGRDQGSLKKYSGIVQNNDTSLDCPERASSYTKKVSSADEQSLSRTTYAGIFQVTAGAYGRGTFFEGSILTTMEMDNQDDGDRRITAWKLKFGVEAGR